MQDDIQNKLRAHSQNHERMNELASFCDLPNREKTIEVYNAAVPVVLSALARRVEDPQGVSSLRALVRALPRVTQSELFSGSLFSGARRVGTLAADKVLGSEHEAVQASFAQASAISKDNTNRLLEVTALVTLATLTDVSIELSDQAFVSSVRQQVGPAPAKPMAASNGTSPAAAASTSGTGYSTNRARSAAAEENQIGQNGRTELLIGAVVALLAVGGVIAVLLTGGETPDDIAVAIADSPPEAVIAADDEDTTNDAGPGDAAAPADLAESSDSAESDESNDAAASADPTESGEAAPVTSDSSNGAAAEDMVEVPAGTYPLGLDSPESNSSESLSQTAEISTFFIDTLEVSNADYKSFVDQTGAQPPASWPRGSYPADLADHPVQGVAHEWATAYCVASSKRLPSEREWEVAARGLEGRIWPWGDDASAVSLPTSDTYPVGSVAGNVSPFGVFDMAGNSWEWVADSYDQRVGENLRVLRGGQNGFLRETVTRLPVDPMRSSALLTAGFRCAADAVDPDASPGTFVEYVEPAGANEPVAIVLPEGVAVFDDFTDPTSGWSEEAVEGEYRLGYHPNEFLHLETRAEFKEAITFGPWRANPDESFGLVTSAFVEPSLTNEEGTFAFGIAFSFDNEGRGLVFSVDERSSTWTIASREPTGSGPYGDDGAEYVVIEQTSRPIPVEISLEVRDLGDDTYEFRINGATMHTRTIPGFDGTAAGLVLTSNADSEKVHIHFEDFQVNELDR